MPPSLQTLPEGVPVSRYRVLDSRGRETVQALADTEYSISNRKK